MNKKILNVYHAPTEKNYVCLCFNTDIFTADCKKYIVDCFLDYSVNPNLRFHSRIDKIIDDVIHEKIKIPHKFRMRLENRHCIESKIIYFQFRVLDKACLQWNVFIKGLSEEMKDAISDKNIDLAVIYEGVQGSRQDIDTDDKGGF
ncbi:MAG: hypothetical protein ACLR60_13410 [Clostridium paraputrificum]